MTTENQGAAEAVVTTNTPTPTAGETQVAAEVKTPEAATEGETNQDGTSTDENAPKPEKKADGGFQRRINRLTADFRAAEAKAQAAEARARELEAKLTAPKTSADEPKRPNLKDFDTYEDYEHADRQFVADQATRKAEERHRKESEEREASAKREADTKRHAEARKRFDTAADQVSENYEDFADIMDDMWRDRIPVISRNNAIAAYIIEESDRGPELAYHLATNEAAAERIGKLSPLAQVKELVKLEASLPKPNAPATKAPPPPKQVGARGGSDTKDPEKMSIDEMRKATGTVRKVDR